MYTALLHTHKLVVLLFLAHYGIKTALLLANRHEALAKYSKPTRIPEMIISFLFLITGGWMLLQTGDVNEMMVFKLVCVFSAIPLAVVGFKRSNKMFAALSLLLLISAYGLAEMSRLQKGKVEIENPSHGAEQSTLGEQVYKQACRDCHGQFGNLGMSGAKPLGQSVLTDEEKAQMIRSGKNSMPPFTSLTDEQITAVVGYINSFKR